MSVPPSKLCPRCNTQAALSAPACLRCGHTYRTKFPPPPGQAQAIPPIPTPLSHPQVATHSAPQHSVPQHSFPARNTPTAAAVALTLIGVLTLGMLTIGGMLAFRKASAARGSSTAVAENAKGNANGTKAVGQRVIINDDGYTGRSHVAMAMNDPADLDAWQKTLGARIIGRSSEKEVTDEDNLNQFERPDDTYSQDRMVQEGRIVVLEQNTAADVLSIDNAVAQVKITEGVNAGLVGMVSKYCLYAPETMQPLYRMPVYHAPPLQRPDGSFYPMAGIDYPADAMHQRGSINHEISPAPSASDPSAYSPFSIPPRSRDSVGVPPAYTMRTRAGGGPASVPAGNGGFPNNWGPPSVDRNPFGRNPQPQGGYISQPRGGFGFGH